MTPEIKAALERVRKYHDAASGLVIYPAGVEASVATDLELLARAFVAEHADDDEPVSLDALDKAARKHALTVYYKGGQSHGVHIAGRIISIKTNRRLRALLEGLGE